LLDRVMHRFFFRLLLKLNSSGNSHEVKLLSGF